MNYSCLKQEIDIGNVKVFELLKDYFECLICDCKISGENQAVSHVLGSKHRKKIGLKNENRGSASGTFNEQLENRSSQTNSKPRPIPAPRHMIPAQEKVENSITSKNLGCADTVLKPNEPSEYYCKLCLIQLNGSTPWMDHIQGKGHLRKAFLAENKMSEGVSSTCGMNTHQLVSSSTDPNLLLEYDRSAQLKNLTGSIGTEILCSTCNISVSGEAPYKQHCAGKLHLKNLQRLKAKEENDRMSDSSSVHDENTQNVPMPDIAARRISDDVERMPNNAQSYSGRNSFITIKAEERVPILFS